MSRPVTQEFRLTGLDGPFGADYLRLLHEAAALDPMPAAVAETLTGVEIEIVTAMADQLDTDGQDTGTLTWPTLWPTHREQAKRRIADALEHLALHGTEGAGAVTLNQVICRLGRVKDTSDLEARAVIRDIAGRGALPTRTAAALTGQPTTSFTGPVSWKKLSGGQQAAIVRRTRHAARLLQDEGTPASYNSVVRALARTDFDKQLANLYTSRIMEHLAGTGKVRSSTAEKVCGTPEGELTRWGPRINWGWIDPKWRGLARKRIHHTVQVMLAEGLDPTYRAVAARIINHPPAGLPRA